MPQTNQADKGEYQKTDIFDKLNFLVYQIPV